MMVLMTLVLLHASGPRGAADSVVQQPDGWRTMWPIDSADGYSGATDPISGETWPRVSD